MTEQRDMQTASKTPFKECLWLVIWPNCQCYWLVLWVLGNRNAHLCRPDWMVEDSSPHDVSRLRSSKIGTLTAADIHAPENGASSCLIPLLWHLGLELPVILFAKPKLLCEDLSISFLFAVVECVFLLWSLAMLAVSGCAAASE